MNKVGIISMEEGMEARGRLMTHMRQVMQLRAFPENQVSLPQSASSLDVPLKKKFFFNLSSEFVLM